jgi:DNA-binding response OmpR family regulator
MRKILIIEDDAIILYALQAKLGLAGFEVESESGRNDKEAILHKIRTFVPELIILDLVLPKIDGFEILEHIRSDTGMNKADIYIYSNLSDKESKEKSLNMGAARFFQKNELNIDEVVDKLIRIVKNKSIYEKV